MMLTASALLLLLLGPGIGAVPSRLWEHQGSSPCVPIPSNMALCQGLGYNSMRMPNLLGHESPAEAVQQSTSWLPLLDHFSMQECVCVGTVQVRPHHELPRLPLT
uniref:FZ domain-containing protein n=1 Tax=Cyprinus carpio TaxID=7962 RepID=A0A8C2CMU6_CYPCA